MTSSRPMTQRIALSAIMVTALAACASGPPSTGADLRTYCMETILKRVRVCTPERVPSAAVEAEAKRFASAPGLLTVYVVRYRWSDAVKLVEFGVDDSTRVSTLPRSLVRLRLEPGEHVLSLFWNGKTRSHRLQGGPGDVLFVDLAGSAYPWEEPYHWSEVAPPDIKARARQSRLVADVW